MSELKLCPFCGKKPNPNWTDGSYIECTNRKCSVYGYGMSTGDWNTRPIEDELRKRIAELETKIRHNALWQASEDAEERAHLEKLVLDLKKRIAELEGENKKAFDFVKTLRTYCIYAHWDNPDTEGEFNEFDAEICKWLSEFTERMEDE